MASQLTHPSLAQRLRAIREAAIAAGVEGFAPKNDGQTPSAPRLIEPCVLVAGQAGEVVVVLDGDHVHWLRAVPAGTPLEAEPLLAAAGERKTMRYDELVDLRHEVKGRAKSHRLVAVRAGERPVVTLIAPADVPRLGRFLASIEDRLASIAPGSEAPESHGLGSWTLRLYGFLIALAAVVPFSGPLVLPLLDAPEVRLDEEPGTWRVDGMEIGERLAPRAVKVVIRGDFSGRPPRVERWVSGAEPRAFPGTWASRRGAIELVTRYEDRAWWLMLFAGDDLGSQQIDRMRLQGDEAETGGSPRLFETTQSIDFSKLGNSPTTPSPSTLRTTAWPSPGMATRVGPRSRCCAGPRGSRASIELFFRAVFSTWTPGDRRLPLTPSDRHTYTALK